MTTLIPIPGTPTYLATKNVHPRDKYISFEPGPHIYTVCGERGTYTSVTTWNHHHFSKFDADAIIDKMFSNKKNVTDPKWKYYGMTKDEIKRQWAINAENASGSGTKTHDDIEKFYNGMNVENDTLEFHYFRQFVKDHPELIAFRTEWMIYHEELKISGSIDMVFENPDGTIQIYDWKRVKEIKHEDTFGKYALTTCISHLPDTNFWHYALQLNVYKMILENKYGKKVTDLYLVAIHPENQYRNYERIKVPFLEKEISDLVNLRMSELASNNHA